MLKRLGVLFARRHLWVLGVWAVGLVALIGVAERNHGVPEDTFAIPGSQSQEALDLLAERFPAANGTSASVVFLAPDGTLDDPAFRTGIDATVAALAEIEGVTAVTSPFDQTPTGIDFDGEVPTVEMAELNIDDTGAVGYAAVQFGEPLGSPAEAEDLVDQLRAAAIPAEEAGLEVDLGGAVVEAGNAPDPGISAYSELIGIAIAVLILLIALGSATSMLVPIVVALISVFVAHEVLDILTAHFTIGSVAAILGSMIGLGVGIDYSLFIVSRFRSELREGMEVNAGVGHALATSGSAVLFAGITVCIALGGLIFVGIPYVGQLGLIAAMFVAIAVLAAVTLLPAVLGLLGHRVNSLKIHHRDEDTDIHQTISARWAQATSRHPVRYVLASLAVLMVLAAPVLRMDLGFTDAGNLDPGLTQRHAYDRLTEHFGAGVNGPLVLAIDLPEVGEDNALEILEAFGRLTDAVAAHPGVERVSLPLPNDLPDELHPDVVPTAAIMQVIPTTAPNADATAELVRELRSDVIPGALEGSALPPGQVFVGGQTATLIDLTEALTTRLPLFIAIVITGAFLLLTMVFRSLFVPLKAALMNLLSIGSAFGVIVAVFQWGWGANLIGLSGTVPVVAFVPVMMFAILFGLSMDYEVFLISRIKEEYEKTGDSRESVVVGLASTARVITAAALIMIAVFLSFVPNPDPTVKMIGLGMAVAVLIDATIVRMMLVPSSMELAGGANWWLPKWLDKILPRIKVE